MDGGRAAHPLLTDGEREMRVGGVGGGARGRGRARGRRRGRAWMYCLWARVASRRTETE